MKVFLVTYSYYKGKWASRATWPVARVFAKTEKEAREKVTKDSCKGYGFRIDFVEDVTGKPHTIPYRTVF